MQELSRKPEIGSPESWFQIESSREKIARLPEVLAAALALTATCSPHGLGRDVRVVPPAELPPKPGLSSRDGQARLLHDLASIELQAMELAVRSLCEYPDAPLDFRHELSELALGEGRHLELCLNHLEALERPWGTWAAHVSLWNLVEADDSLIDRVLKVHRYLEGSGLDAGESILRRLQGVASKSVRRAVDLIVREEIDHVRFGSDWYRKLCERERLDPQIEFESRMPRIAALAPRKENIARELRQRAGFTTVEIEFIEKLRSAHQVPESAISPRVNFPT